jgi:hypothetical protein
MGTYDTTSGNESALALLNHGRRTHPYAKDVRQYKMEFSQNDQFLKPTDCAAICLPGGRPGSSGYPSGKVWADSFWR